jgi:dipeptidyl aminopeptidase/acylaminoacyl peptidase
LDWHPSGKEVTRSYAEGTDIGLETIDIDTLESFIFKKSKYGFLNVSYSHDGKWIACGASTKEGSEIQVINREDPEDIIIYSIKEDSKETSPVWSHDDKWIAFQTDARGYRQLAVQEFKGSRRIFLELDEGEEVQNSYRCAWTPRSDKLYYSYSKHSRSFIRGHSLKGQKDEPLLFPEGQLGELRLSDDGKIMLVFHSSMNSPGAFYRHVIGTSFYARVTPRNFNTELLDMLVEPRSVWYESFDGRRIHGWYLKGKRTNNDPAPGLVFVHGGPTDQVFDEWRQGVYLQAIADSGFSVFAINYRGSTGYGSEFQNLNVGDIGGGDLEDVVYAAKWLASQVDINPNKIGISGASYGGYMTLFALVRKPKVFKVGLALVPVIDWIADYEHLPANRIDTLFGGTPDEKEDLYKDRSPISHISNIKAPVMIVAGDQDSRCPIEPIREFVKKLKELNNSYKYIEYKQAGHNISLENRNRRAMDFSKMMRFLKKHLK